MVIKTVTVPHPEAHGAPPGALEDAATEAGVPEGYTVKSYTAVSGDSTKYVLEWDDGTAPPKDEKAVPKNRPDKA